MSRWPSGALAACLAVTVCSCSFDNDAPAPHIGPPQASNACGDTDQLFSNLSAFIDSGGFAPLADVIARHLVPTDANPHPDPSFRELLAAIVRVVTAIGLDKTRDTAAFATESQTLADLEPLIVAILRFVDGSVSGTDHYDALAAGAFFVRACNPDHLLGAVEALLRLESPSGNRRLWLAVLFDELEGLLRDPLLDMFLTEFENDAARGRPAIVAVLDQILRFLGDEDFDISRVDTLLESAVYPLADDELERKIIRMVDLLQEATDQEAGILMPLQRAVRCGLEHEPQRKELLGLVYDLIVSPELGLDALFASANGLVSDDQAVIHFELIADLVHVIREDVPARDDLRDLLVLLLSPPESQKVTPVLIELIEAKVVGQVFEVVAKLLGDCGMNE